MGGGQADTPLVLQLLPPLLPLLLPPLLPTLLPLLLPSPPEEPLGDLQLLAALLVLLLQW